MGLKLKIPEIQYSTKMQRHATVTVSNIGMIQLNLRAKEITGITNGDSLALAVDEDKPLDWYLIHVKDPKDGLVCKIGEGKSEGPRIQCSSWAKKLKMTLGESDNKRAIRIPLATAGFDTELGTAYALLTKVYLDNKAKNND